MNVEAWKPLKRLPGHESGDSSFLLSVSSSTYFVCTDVTDIAWAPEDRYLASVGLDSKVIVWCGYTLGIFLPFPCKVQYAGLLNEAQCVISERIRKLDQHNGFVKGVCFDPVGEFMATQSDDKSVKIWRTTDWGLEAEIREPFEDSPTCTFFRRLR